jgi:O-antigen/teichoic acid export membrane protein
VKGAVRKLFKSRIAHNAASIYLVQACRKLLPLVTLPYLAHVLGPSGWGDVVFTQSMGESIAAFAGAHVTVRIVFGRTFEPAVALLQILALHPFITSLSDAIGFQSLLPAGKEVIVTKAVVAGGLVNLAFAFVSAPRFLGKGWLSRLCLRKQQFAESWYAS